MADWVPESERAGSTGVSRVRRLSLKHTTQVARVSDTVGQADDHDGEGDGTYMFDLDLCMKCEMFGEPTCTPCIEKNAHRSPPPVESPKPANGLGAAKPKAESPYGQISRVLPPKEVSPYGQVSRVLPPKEVSPYGQISRILPPAEPKNPYTDMGLGAKTDSFVPPVLGTSEHKRSLAAQKIFRNLDTDGNGEISKLEIIDFCNRNHLNVAKLQKALSIQGKYTITIMQFVSKYRAKALPADINELIAATAIKTAEGENAHNRAQQPGPSAGASNNGYISLAEANGRAKAARAAAEGNAGASEGGYISLAKAEAIARAAREGAQPSMAKSLGGQPVQTGWN